MSDYKLFAVRKKIVPKARETKDYVLNNPWKFAAAAAVGGILYSGVFETQPTLEEQTALDSIVESTVQLKARAVQECSPANAINPINPIHDYRAERAVDRIKEYYDTPQEVAEVLKFFREQGVIIHSTSLGFKSTLQAVFYNNADENSRVLILGQGLFTSDYRDQLKPLIEGMMDKNLLEQNGTHVIFKNLLQAEDSFNDRRYLPDEFALTGKNIVVIEGNPVVSLDIAVGAWENPCPSTPSL
jgi:hypothetical protein